jgi:hypothetical protein
MTTYSYDDWAAEALTPDPGGSADPDLCRQDYLMECSDRGLRWEPRSKQRGAVEKVGGRPIGTGSNLRYIGVVLAPPRPSWMSRGQMPPKVVGESIAALRDAGLITPEQAIVAALDLTKEER